MGNYKFYTSPKPVTCNDLEKKFLLGEDNSSIEKSSEIFSAKFQDNFLKRKDFFIPYRNSTANIKRWYVKSQPSKFFDQFNRCIMEASQTLAQKKEEKKQTRYKECKDKPTPSIHTISRGKANESRKLTEFCRIPISCEPKSPSKKIPLTASCEASICEDIQRNKISGKTYSSLVQSCIKSQKFYSRKKLKSGEENPRLKIKSLKGCTLDDKREMYIAKLETASSAFCEVKSCVLDPEDNLEKSKIAICQYIHSHQKIPNKEKCTNSQNCKGCSYYEQSPLDCFYDLGVEVKVTEENIVNVIEKNAGKSKPE